MESGHSIIVDLIRVIHYSFGLFTHTPLCLLTMSIQYLDRSLHLPTSPEQIISRSSFDHWMMTDAERSALTVLLEKIRPQCVIEIGTYRAGSLKVLSKFAEHVYSLDIDPSCKDDYSKVYKNVEFLVGYSKDALPEALEKINSRGQALGFVLIDGNHSEEGVRDDINRLLKYKPSSPIYVIMHDSFNPGCRRGIRTANWEESPHVHLLELDYVTGRLMTKEEGSSYRQMWCGFALAILLPETRMGEFLIHENESMGYKAAFWRSKHPYSWMWSIRELKRLLKRIMG